jgi:hypothetical protein
MINPFVSPLFEAGEVLLGLSILCSLQAWSRLTARV